MSITVCAVVLVKCFVESLTLRLHPALSTTSLSHETVSCLVPMGEGGMTRQR